MRKLIKLPWACRRMGSPAFGEAHWWRRTLPRTQPTLALCASASWRPALPLSSRIVRTPRAATSSTLPPKSHYLKTIVKHESLRERVVILFTFELDFLVEVVNVYGHVRWGFTACSCLCHLCFLSLSL